ncbi:type-2 ice-structuring protein-like [Clinocottus analis]|uniref:type-2 ice-structuring protein-like n=1 Tax=Clinocottus analis TaxID=304258 RepID=UPI0035C0C5FE
MLTVSLLVCAMMALTGVNGADDNATAPIRNTATLPLLFPRANIICPSGWNVIGQRCYYHEKTLKTWAEAEKNCQTRGGNLASILSYTDQSFLLGKIANIAWIGGSACQEAGVWLWTDGQPMFFASWCAAKPDNELSTCCMQLTAGVGKCWDDIACSNAQESICILRTH